jgi:phosphoribosyl-ATP pyrophosphohydrolase
MIKYLLLKLAEEAGEVVVAAIKHRLHRTDATRRELEGEIADLSGIVRILVDEFELDTQRMDKLSNQRKQRELKRAKGR